MAAADRTEQFLALYNCEQRRIYAFIRSMLSRTDDAEEVFQETCAAMWRAFGDFTLGTNFSAWSRQIALNRVLAFCKKRDRDRLVFDSDLLSLIAESFEQSSELLAARHKAFDECVQKLVPSDRELLSHRYQEKATVAEIAEKLGRPVNTINKAMQRLRRALLNCIERTIAREGYP